MAVKAVEQDEVMCANGTSPGNKPALNDVDDDDDDDDDAKDCGLYTRNHTVSHARTRCKTVKSGVQC